MPAIREVYSLLMPIQDGRLVIPRAAVAEVMGYSKPKERPDDAPDFLLGFIEWQEQRIPLVSFEAARGKPMPEFGRRTRIAVVFGIGGRLNPDVFAVVTQGYPYLVRVNENVLKPEPIEDDDALILARVRMANEKPYIPDLEELENRIADSLGLQAAAAADEAPVEEVDELDAFGTGEEEDFEAGLLDEPSPEDGDAEDFTGFSSDDDLQSPEAKGAEVSDEADAPSFGSETDFSAELDEMSSALEGGSNTELASSGNDDDAVSAQSSSDDDDYAIDLSGFEVDESEPGIENLQDVAGTVEDNDEDVEIDLSDLSFDLDDEDEKKSD